MSRFATSVISDGPKGQCSALLPGADSQDQSSFPNFTFVCTGTNGGSIACAACIGTPEQRRLTEFTSGRQMHDAFGSECLFGPDSDKPLALLPGPFLCSNGRPGKDKATTVQKVGVPVNVIATLGLLLSVFGGKDLGAAAKMVTVSNEEGIQVSHYVPSESFRRANWKPIFRRRFNLCQRPPWCTMRAK